MTSAPLLAGVVALLGISLAATARATSEPRGVEVAAPRAVSQTSVSADASHNGVIQQYCVACHNDRSKTGGLTLADFDVARADGNTETAEKIIHKLRAGMMPPPGARRPDPDTIKALVVALETRIDRAAALHPDPGRRTFQRLNRAEYTRSIRELLDLDIDVDALLPADTISHNFDNISDVQSLSPTVMESYLRAAREISLAAVGDPKASPKEATYRVPRAASQMVHVEGTPLGTRGGVFVVHTFPADGEYRFKMIFHSTSGGVLWGSPGRNEQIEVSVDGERVALLNIDPTMSETDPNGLTLQTEPVRVVAGPRRVAAAFVQHAEGPVDDLVAPIQFTLADQQIGDAYGVTVLPHLRDLSIKGPYAISGVSETPSRRKILVCRPATPGEEIPCARKIISVLATRAYRKPTTPAVLDPLIRFFEAGRKQGDFMSGIRTALEAILASPRFVFRLEQQPREVASGQNYRIDSFDLASRLAYFLWATLPDSELLDAAGQGTLQNPATLEHQVRRMLADPRAEALSTRFAAQWLRLQDLHKLHPEPYRYPQYDARLSDAMQRETELFVDSIVRDDRSVLELLTGTYTFVNERLAKHYGLANVTGSHFRRLEISDENRRGLLGQGSILMLTSTPDRTSPVQRGKWILEVLLGSPPPPPPPNVPSFDDTKDVAGSKKLSVRERMEEHRKSPACTSCHRVIDPLGLALENFDVTGAWRTKDNGNEIDASGALYDGTALAGPAGLRQALLKHSDMFIRTFTSNLMAYALGRRIEYSDMPAVRAIERQAALEGNRFSSFVVGVVNSAAFQMSRAEALRTER